MSGRERHLVASHPGNRHGERSGAYARRDLAQDEEVQAMAQAIMEQPFAEPIDLLGAVEIAKLIVLLDRIDADLAARGLTKPKTGEVRGIVDLRLRASRRLAEWLDRYGGTPLSRATWAKELAQGGLAAEIARRRAKLQEATDER